MKERREYLQRVNSEVMKALASARDAKHMMSDKVLDSLALQGEEILLTKASGNLLEVTLSLRKILL